MYTHPHSDARYNHPGSLGVRPQPILCRHPAMLICPSPYAASPKADYRRTDITTLCEAAGSFSSVIPPYLLAYSSTFPGPLVLPGDALLWVPDVPQPFLRWAQYMRQLQRDTMKIRKIYIIEPPFFTPETQRYMAGWDRPQLQEHQKNAHRWPRDQDFPPWATGQLVDYLKAFYYGMTVKLMANAWVWVRLYGTEAAPRSNPKNQTNKRIGSEPWSGCIGLRHRRTGQKYRVHHRSSLDRVARQQFNYMDVEHALMDQLPDDAYAVIILNHDVSLTGWRDGNPGWANVKKRVSVVSTFRLRPALDTYNNLMINGQIGHEWPLSHCLNYVQQMCAEARSASCSSASDYEYCRSFSVPVDYTSPLGAAITAASGSGQRTGEQWTIQFLFRVCSVTCHEVGHLLGMDHCLYYACVMQAAGHNPELFRTPPYLCPVCLQKMSALLSRCTMPQETRDGGIPTLSLLQWRWIKKRYQALLEVCQRHGRGSMFEAYGTWIGKRLDQMSG